MIVCLKPQQYRHQPPQPEPSLIPHWAWKASYTFRVHDEMWVGTERFGNIKCGIDSKGVCLLGTWIPRAQSLREKGDQAHLCGMKQNTMR